MKRNTGDILNATGDVFNATGDVFPSGNIHVLATGDMINASGDMINAVNPLSGKTQDEVDAIYRTGGPNGGPKPYDSDYYAWLDEDEATETTKTDKGGGTLSTVFGIFSQTLGLVDKGTDIYNKFKTGATVEEGGVAADVKMGDPAIETKPNNKIWYIAGGAILLLVVVGVVVSRKGKGK